MPEKTMQIEITEAKVKYGRGTYYKGLQTLPEATAVYFVSVGWAKDADGNTGSNKGGELEVQSLKMSTTGKAK